MNNPLPAVEVGPQPLTEAAQERTAVADDGMHLRYTVEGGADGDTATLIAQGFYGIQSAYAGFRSALATPETAAVTVREQRTHSLADALFHVAEDLSERDGITNFRIVGHSLGGPAAAKAGELIIGRRPDLNIESLTIMASACITSAYNIKALTRLSTELLVSQLTANQRLSPTALREIVSYTLRPQIAVELFSVGHCNLLQMLDRLRRGHDVPTAAISFVADGLFPPKEAARKIGRAVNLFTVMKTPRQAGHLAPNVFPVETAHTYEETRLALAA
ncbi:MAG: hypothetical protein JWN38_415 [Candidatus Saccharibacteria bacterium]|nr:hypothetical protein [Candidatus Saccharibacteria bacterium]